MSTPHKDWDTFQTLEEAKKVQKKFTGWISHLLLNDDKTYSIMCHINCEWCDYCEEGNEKYSKGEKKPYIHNAKDNAYEIQGR